MKKTLTHFDKLGHAHMVDVGKKPETLRIAKAEGTICMKAPTLNMINTQTGNKGDVLGVARIAAIQAAKRTADLIPLCHPLPLTKISVDFNSDKRTASITMEVCVQTRGRTGVEMEALTGISVGLLTIYDMCKSVDREMTINNIRLLEKSGGKSGTFLHPKRKIARGGKA